MARHIFKMVWNRKSANALVVLEIFISFLVLFAVVAMTTQFVSYYRTPLGFEYENRWDIGISTGGSGFGDAPADMGMTIERMRVELEVHDQVESVAVAVFGPYESGRSSTQWTDAEIRTHSMRVSLSYLETMGMTLEQGRWFEPSDEHVHWIPTVLSRELAEAAFGSEDPIGQVVIEKDDDGDDEYRVVGVVSTFRRQGEFAPPVNVLFRAAWPADPVRFPRRHLQVELSAGTTAAFEETMMKTLQGVAPSWSFDLQSVEGMRESYVREHMVPIFAVSTVAAFLMVMVALGLMGVLWQNVTQRTRELGLRRAKGATQQNIYRQILSELLIVAGLGIVLGTIVVVQVPILDLAALDVEVFVKALVLSTVSLLSLTALCGLYPAWLATRIRPAEALHYE
jgi:putative ABC transport system permease protein